MPAVVLGLRRFAGTILLALVAATLTVGFVASKSRGSADAAGASGASARKGAAQTTPATDLNLLQIGEGQMQGIRLEAVREHTFEIEKDATGKIAFNEDVVTPVFSPYTGRVLRLLARPGDRVRRGSPLFEIDTPDLVQAESDVITAGSAVTKAKTQLDLARRVEDRQRRLYLNKAAALKDLEQAESDVKNVGSELRSAEAALAAARDRLRVFGKTDAEIAAIETERRIDRVARVSSPIAGTITGRKVGPGQYVKPDSPDPLFTIADLSTLWLLANVYEADVPFIKRGEPVEVRVMAYPSEVFKARISYIGASMDSVTHRVPVRAKVDNRDGRLKQDMFATFRILTASDVQSPAVPLSAIVRDGDSASIWVVEKGSRFARRVVKLGLEQNGYVAVQSGVRPGETVVADGSVFLSNAGRSLQ